MKSNSAGVQGAQLLHRACDILDLISRSDAGMGHAELMQETGLARATIYRILSVLGERGLVRHKPSTGAYALGSQFVERLRAVSGDSGLFRVAEPELMRLRDMTGETAYLAIAEGTDVVAIGKFEGPHAIRSASQLGTRKPLYCTSQGKAILSVMDETDRAELLRRIRLKPVTQHTITDKRRLSAELRLTQVRGFSLDDEEIVLGIRCVGAPIVDAQGHVLGAVSIAGPAFRLSLERLHALGPELAAVGQLIGSQIRALPPPSDIGLARYDSVMLAPKAPPAFKGLPPRRDPETGRIWYADALAPKLRCLEPDGKDRAVLTADAAIAGIELGSAGTLHMVTTDGVIHLVDPDGASHGTWAADLPEDYCVRATATMGAQLLLAAFSETAQSTLIGTIHGNGTIIPIFRVASDVCALSASADGQLIHCASAAGTIHRWVAGEGTARLLVRLPAGSGKPSSIATDTNGRLWVALTNGWAVARLNEIGEFDLLVPMPMPAPSGIAFGGAEPHHLFVLSARVDVPFDALQAAPLSGQLLRVDVPITD